MKLHSTSFIIAQKTKLLWDQFKEFFSNTTLSIPSLTPQSAILGHIHFSDDYLSINHLILICKFHICNSRNTGHLSIEHLKTIIDKIKSIEEEIILKNGVLSLTLFFKCCNLWVRNRRGYMHFFVLSL